MRRVNCKHCGVLVEEVPWGMGKHSSTKVHMHFLGHWARKLSWKETAEEFRTSWDKVHDAVAYLVTWGWSIASWERFAPLAWMRFNAAKGTNI
jgi:transposase